ncbi:MAG TPA: hypothetical protein VM165_00640 [Planctomycetaceae bacterium]|nr:hypothetical protein [Planctomycetaceae bacterium]
MDEERATPVGYTWPMTTSDDTPKAHRFRFGLRSLLLAVSVCAVFLAGYGLFLRRIVEPRRQADAVERHLESLAQRRPQEVSPQQWESAVAWTLNLHGNSLLRFQADGPTISRFEQRLSEKLSGDVDLTTILWIWDEYAALCPGGASYQRFRSMMIEEIEGGGSNWGLQVR